MAEIKEVVIEAYCESCGKKQILSRDEYWSQYRDICRKYFELECLQTQGGPLSSRTTDAEKGQNHMGYSCGDCIGAANGSSFFERVKKFLRG